MSSAQKPSPTSNLTSNLNSPSSNPSSASSASSASSSTSASAPASNIATDDTATKVKPCCVCKDEKAARDECMLFTQSDDPQRECQDLVGRYKDCMAGFGFQI